MDIPQVSEGHADKGDEKEAMTMMKKQARSTRGAYEDLSLIHI